MARFARRHSINLHSPTNPINPTIKINLTRKTPGVGYVGNLGSPVKLKKIAINNESHPNIFIK